jgi:anti-sigma B factor antagonist
VASDGADPPVFALDATRGDDGRTTIAVTGELDIANVGELATAVHEALAGGDVTIDLRELTFMDSAGVQTLNTALREATEAGRDMRVVAAMQPAVAQILELTGMMGLLTLAEDSR